MRIAKDGKSFDVDTIGGDLAPDEVEIIQFLRPGGKRRRMAATVGADTVRRADDLIISAEELITGEVALYGRKIGEKKENEIVLLAENRPGEKSPNVILTQLIKELTKKEVKTK